MDTSAQSAETTDNAQLASGKLGVWAIVFFVMSAAAPLTVVVSGAPLTVKLGGIGGPGAMLAAGAVLLLFAAGFTAMSRHVQNTGAFYAYATEGLGRAVGAGTAAMTTLGYIVLLLAFYGFIAFFADLTANGLFGLDLPWIVWGLLVAVVVGFLGSRQVDIGARVLAVLLMAEVTLLLAVSLAVLIKGGPEPLSLAPFAPSNWLGASTGGLLVLGFGAYIGFEGTAIYAEEAKDPERTVPRATYIAITFLAVFYAFAFWCFIMAFGVDGITKAVAGEDWADLPFAQANTYLGPLGLKAMQVLIVTSFLACLLAFHNAAARYLFSLGRSGLLPRWLGHTDPKHHSPTRASYLLSAVAVVGLLATLVFGWDPYLDLGVKPYAAGVMSIVLAQAICAIAVVAFFLRDRRGYSALRVLVAPALGALGLLAACWFIATNFEIVSGGSGTMNVILIAVAPVAFALGVLGHLVRRDRVEAEVRN